MTKADYPIPDSVFEQHSAWLATSGAGKTTAVKGGVERMLARGERVVIIDPTGVWWGLRFQRDGRHVSPYEVVIFGLEHADLPIGPGSGEAIARALGASSTSAILSLKGMRVSERTRFITDFFETLISANRGLLNLIVDEIHLFAPQSGGSGLTPMMLHATNNLVSLGRAAGLRIAMISQRPAKVHKDSLTQGKSLIALQCSHPLDQKPIREWLATSVPDKATGQAIMSSLAGLRTGAGWLSAPQIGLLERVTFPMIKTFDSSRPGVEEIPLKPLDVAALREAMLISSTTNEKGKINTGPDLTSESGAKARAEKVKSDVRPANAAELAAAEQRGYERGVRVGADVGIRVGWNNATGRLREKIEGAAHAAGRFDPDMHAAMIDAALEEVPGNGAKIPAKTTAKYDKKYDERMRPEREAPAPLAVSKPNGHHAPTGGLTPALQRVLDALGWWRAAGQPMVPRDRASVVAGYSPKASTFGVYIGDLVKRGLVMTGHGVVGLTEAGVALATVPEMPTREAAREAGRALLKPQERRVFDAIYDAFPNSIRRDAVAEAIGLSPTASTIGVYIGTVAGFGLVETAGRGEVKAAAWLFKV